MKNEKNQQQDPTSRQAAEQLLEVIPYLMRLIRVEAQGSGGEEALTTTQARALTWLIRGRRLPSELAREMDITPATASEVVETLMRRGLVEREIAPADRRCKPLRVTEAGLAVYDASRQRSLAALRQLLNKLPADEAQALAIGLRALLHVLQADHTDERTTN